MKRFFPFFLLAFLALCVPVRRICAQPFRRHSQTPNILVATIKVQCPTATYTTIQSAVNAARPGDIIRVCAGTYDEQVVMTNP